MTAPRSFKQEICKRPWPAGRGRTLTQFMLEKAFRHHGLDWRYITCEVAPASLADAVRGMRAMGFRGGNCTIPHKVAVIEHLDRLSEAAELMGAVNCIVRQGDELVGDNTDGKGFVQSLRTLTDPAGKQIVLLWAAGAAGAIAVELEGLAGRWHEIAIVNRDDARGRELANLITDKIGVRATHIHWQGDFRVPAETDVLVNATPIGLFPDVDARVPLDTSTLRSSLVVADAVSSIRPRRAAAARCPA